MKQNLAPYRKGYVEVSDIHQLYFELYGNPKGIPVLYLHGGPGSGFSDGSKKKFDKRRYNVILFDQRGSARSKPFGSIENNTTQDLVDDINKLLDYLSFEKVYIFGGSWGSTLALVYAIQNPERTLGLILRGIFLANQDAIKYYIDGGIKDFFPDVWNRFIKQVEPGKNPVDYYLKKMLSTNTKESNKFTYEWAYYETSICSINQIEDIDKELQTFSYKTLAILEAYYMKNNCFLPEDYIMKNIDKIKDIKISITQGRYDFICPPKQAFRLHSKLNNSKLNIVDAGHSSSDKEIKKTLKTELKRVTS